MVVWSPLRVAGATAQPGANSTRRCFSVIKLVSLLLAGSVTLERAEVLLEGEPARGQMTIGPGSFMFAPVDRQNHPEKLRRHLEISDQWARDPQPGREITMRIPLRGSIRRANLSWIRSAFVAAFATFGYLYTFQPAFEELLAQIQSPDEHLIDHLPITFDNSAAANTCEIALVTRPRVLSSILIRTGRTMVFLPAERDDCFFGEFPNRQAEMAALAPDPTALSIETAPFVWPTSPQHLFDGINH